jgi:UDP-N-acetylglucosamine--dolichyl-phosphate N-acetylglucosaminephosphotransferase
MRFWTLLLVIVVSFAFSYLSTSWIIGNASRKGYTGRDVNKPDRRVIPSLGGIGVMTGFVAGGFTLEIMDPGYARVIEPIISSSLLIGFLGLLDDILNLNQKIRAILPIFAAVPLSVASLGHSQISIPFLGPVSFGIFYNILIIPLALTISSNAFNMLEGLNGLGAGMGIIMSLVLAYIGVSRTGPIHVAGVLALALTGSLLAFLSFNKYPAKVFPGNIGTYFIGAVIGSLGIAGYMLTATAVLYLPYVVEFLLKARTGFRGVSFGIPDGSGRLQWNGPPHSLTHLIMKIGRLNEAQVVLILWGIEALFAVLAIYVQTTTIVI